MCARWGLVPDRALTGAGSGTWPVRRHGTPFALKFLSSPSWEHLQKHSALLG